MRFSAVVSAVALFVTYAAAAPMPKEELAERTMAEEPRGERPYTAWYRATNIRPVVDERGERPYTAWYRATNIRPVVDE